MADKTIDEMSDIETKVITLMELGELDDAVTDYIGLLQDAIIQYQGKLYSKNSEIMRLKSTLEKQKPVD
ncbi:centrosomal protein [Pseudoalteromonas phage vB_Pun_Y3]